MCRLVLEETGLLPHANAGALSEDELASLRPVSASQGMMLESLNAELECHRGSPDKTPERRLATLEAAGRLQIPFTTGILVGIGESRADRTEARGFTLAPRLTAYPSYVLDPERWLDPALRFAVMDRSDAEGLGREPGERWYSGSEDAPPRLVPVPAGSARAGGAVGEVLAGVLMG